MDELSTDNRPLRAIATRLRTSPGLRGVAYLGAAAALLEGVSAALGPAQTPEAGLLLHLAVLPGGLLITAAFLRLEGRRRWTELPIRAGLRQLGAGAALGAAAFLAVAGSAAAQGWASAPEWGWEQAAPGAVLQAVAFQSLGHLAVAWNEELVFRGYGFATLREAWGEPAAIVALTLLFAAFHQLTPRVLLGQAALGAALMALRVASGGLWLPLGYHWAWNVMQTAVLGPPDGLPSLRPLTVTGPAWWLGRPGHPEPGLLSAAVNLAVAGGVWWLGRCGTRSWP